MPVLRKKMSSMPFHEHYAYPHISSDLAESDIELDFIQATVVTISRVASVQSLLSCLALLVHAAHLCTSIKDATASSQILAYPSLVDLPSRPLEAAKLRTIPLSPGKPEMRSFQPTLWRRGKHGLHRRAAGSRYAFEIPHLSQYECRSVGREVTDSCRDILLRLLYVTLDSWRSAIRALVGGHN